MYDRLFFSDRVTSIFQSSSGEFDNYPHDRDLIEALDDKYFDCVFGKMPSNCKELAHSHVLIMKELANRFADDDPRLDSAFRGIFDGALKYEEEIKIPCEARIFIAALFLHDLETKGGIPNPVKNSSLTRSYGRYEERMKSIFELVAE